MKGSIEYKVVAMIISYRIGHVKDYVKVLQTIIY